jgi:hypothetical protein
MEKQWKKDCIKKGKFDYYPIKEKEFFARYRSYLRGATVSETMGPNWKPIVWLGGRPLTWEK